MEAGAEGGEEGQTGSGDSRLTLSPAARGRLSAAGPSLVVTVVSLWLTRSFWTPGSYVIGFDTFAYSGPNVTVTETAYREWRLPLVNDLIFGGVPHLGNPQAAALYPPQLLSLLMETNRTMGVLVALHVVLLGVGMTVLVRRLDVGRVGATAAGVAAVAIGTALTKTVQFEQILVIAWAPLLLASIHATLTAERPWRPCAAVAATTAALLLAGHPQHVYQSAVLAIAATIGFAIGDERWRRLPHLAVGVAIGVVIALPQLVAALAATADSAITGGRNIDELASPALALQPRATVRALLGTVQDRDPAVFAGGFESIGFLGVVVSILAVVGAVHAVTTRRSRPWAISLCAMAALALIWAMGPRTVVFEAAYEVVPGFDLARASARWLVVVGLVAALFAGVGVDRLVGDAHRRHLVTASALVAAVAGALLVGPFDTADRRSAGIWAVTAIVVLVLMAVGAFVRRDRPRTPDIARIAVASIVVLGGLELIAMSLHSMPQTLQATQPFTSFDTATTTWLRDQDGGSTIALTDDGATTAYQIPGFRPNANVLAGVPSIDGYDGGVQITERWADALRRFTPTPPTELPLRNSLQIPIEPETMARLGVRFALLDRDRPADQFVPGWVGPRATDAEFEVWENPAWIGDAVAWQYADPVDGEPADALREDPTGTAGVAIVDDVDAALDCALPALQCRPIGLQLDRRSSEHLVVTTDLDVATIVSVSRQALPGWTVEIDGDGAEEIVVDGLFLGVEVPPGDHTVEWRYRSPWLRLTLVLSVLGVAAAIALAIGGTVIRRA